MNEKKSKIETIIPKNEKQWLELRSKDLTSTEISALFGVNPYTTAFETWHRHFGDLKVDFQPNERAVWGSRLEKAIAKGIAEDRNWKIRQMNEYMRDPERRIGASFDFSVETDDSVMEIKNVDSLAYKEGWLEDEEGNIEAPSHIELQVQQQLAISGRPKAYIAALIGGNKVKIIEREPDKKVIASIYEKAEEFWKSIEAGKEPEVNFARDWETIRQLNNQVEADKIVDVRGDDGFSQMINSYKEIKSAEKDLDEKIKTIKSRILMNAGKAEKIIGDGFSISLGIVRGGPVSYQREDYRNFRVNFKKEKNNG